MRRKDKEQTRQWALDQLDQGIYGVLSIVDTKNRPYGVPVNYVYKDGFLYIHGAQKGMKVDSIGQGTQASFSLVSQEEVVAEKFSSAYKSVICFGQIKPLEDPDQKIKALRLFIEKYAKDFLQEGYAYVARAQKATQVFVLKIDEVSGKVSKA